MMFLGGLHQECRSKIYSVTIRNLLTLKSEHALLMLAYGHGVDQTQIDGGHATPPLVNDQSPDRLSARRGVFLMRRRNS